MDPVGSQRTSASADRSIPVSIVDPLTRDVIELAGGVEPHAQVKLPRPEDLAVRLVQVSALQRLDELRSDVSIHLSMLTTAGGLIVGFLTNVLTSNQPFNPQYWPFLGLLGLTAITFGGLTWRASRRAERIRRRLFDDQEPGNPPPRSS
jgi:hypothetical protein